jgi:hypothetical protein
LRPRIESLLPPSEGHDLSIGYAWAAGIFFVGAVLCSQIVRGKNILVATTEEIEAVESEIPAI